MNQGYFYTIDKRRQTTIKIKRSTFICTMVPVAEMSDAKAFISEISKEYRTANHNCWAYIIGKQQEISHSSDAGEPAGTAGKPMLNSMLGNQMTQVAAVVTRFFGGVKLGVRGLMDAYAESVVSTIESSSLKKLVDMDHFNVTVSYEFNDLFLSLIKPFSPQVFGSEYSDRVTHTMGVEVRFSGDFQGLLVQYQAQGKIVFKKVRQV
jgi:uncharacterized YigZ family protein